MPIANFSDSFEDVDHHNVSVLEKSIRKVAAMWEAKQILRVGWIQAIHDIRIMRDTRRLKRI